ncbi:helix-turn-helix transcriptional regulator [Mucilaginibacter psychrotolerans]|nr:AlpA family phage regulatory protein [Mucilaginibacter psychrotolerans]
MKSPKRKEYMMNQTIETMGTPATLTIPKIMNTEEVLQLLNISRSTFYRGIKAGRYPKPFKRSTKLNGWDAYEIARMVKEGCY